ncbi:hypothetical protein [Paenibacillus sp. FSL H8-0034]|uniref:hypothetical protein n=1 Tax=Paenibacillus sp. FSL H8-0034 TaxID=2954671 RepID=UPI0030FB215D
MIEDKQIKHVAVYLRKSRDDGDYEDVLSKHRDILLAIVNSKNWTYRLYEEGMWTNGKPPFPYYYDKNPRTVLVDETKLPNL